ncbi:MAG TPA: ABC transporter ATP-binding protein, partial [Hyphomicrobiaceae bacterium]|nr:ABC transporter ATP-binding protein [Hyphomicrobiaceae bacterium]
MAEGGAVARSAIERAIETLDLTALSGRPADRLSGGELARVLLARALAQEAAILIADEPTASLDPAHQIAVFDELRRLARGGSTVIAALHDLSLTARYADEVWIIAGGSVRASGTPDVVLTADVLSDVFAIPMQRGEIGGVPAIVA